MCLKAKNCSKISSINSVSSPQLISSIFLYVTDGRQFFPKQRFLVKALSKLDLRSMFPKIMYWIVTAVPQAPLLS
jgi:hypothetical protein